MSEENRIGSLLTLKGQIIQSSIWAAFLAKMTQINDLSSTQTP